MIDRTKAASYTPETLALLKTVAPEIVREIEQVREETKPRLIRYLDMFITLNPEMNKMKERIRMVAGEPDPVLIQGETGTGKELLANALHCNRTGQFVAANCAGLPEHLIESELFGHTRGAFTGAAGDRTGMLEAAQDGTIFLDEIGELPLALQAKLLRALQEMKIRKVGANNEIEINCRLVTATHHDLTDLVERSMFREDLYWRISTIVFKTLPLRLRQKDIIPLLKHFDTDHCIENYEYFANRINPATDLKGNVRTIQQLVRRYQLFEQLPGESL